MNIVIVGPGLIGIKHAELVSKHPDLKLICFVGPSSSENISAASRFCTPLISSLHEASLIEHIDGVIIASPNLFHFDQAKYCVENDIPVLIEKPVVNSLDEAKQLVEITRGKESRVLVGHHRAHSEIIRVAKKFIRDGQLGKIVAISGFALFYKPSEYFEAGPWRMFEGGGPILINLIHEIGNLRALCGEIVSVNASATSVNRNFEVEDTAVMTFRFESGALGTFLISDCASSNYSWEQTSGENKAYVKYSADCYTVFGSNGQLEIPSMRYSAFTDESKRSWLNPMDISSTLTFDDIDPLELQLQNFVDVINTTSEPVVSLRDGVSNLMVVFSIMESIRLKREVKVSLID